MNAITELFNFFQENSSEWPEQAMQLLVDYMLLTVKISPELILNT